MLNTRSLLYISMLLIAMFGIGIYLYTVQSNVFWAGYLSISIFYGIIFGIGLKAADLNQTANASEVLVANRTMPLVLSIFTMAATWIDGGYINGSAEYTATPSYGLLWVQAPWGYALSLVVGGLFFAKKMHRYRFKTMLDPLEQRFGKRVAAILFLPPLCGEIFWTAAILTALGMTFSVIAGLSADVSIIISAIVCIAYTAVGGLWAIALTDIILLSVLFIGLILVVGFGASAVGGVSHAWSVYSTRMGNLATIIPSHAALGTSWWYWWDSAFLLILGGVPWQVYFQRVLSARDEQTAQNLSILGGVVCLLVAFPAVMIGVIGYVYPLEHSWTADAGAPAAPESMTMIAPYVMRYLTTPWVATLGMGAIAAAVMSSVAASTLSASSMASWNIYRPLIRPRVTATELATVLRSSVWIIGMAATLLALRVQSVYQLWVLCSDFVYCMLFPPLLLSLYDKKANSVGAIAGFMVAFVLRFGGGDTTLGLPCVLPYPTDDAGIVTIPYKTLAMVASLLTIMIVSRLTLSVVPSVPLREQTE
jgi:high affinity choline transporter 7